MQISGDLTVDGSITYINTTELDVSDNIIQINTGLTGTPPVNMVSGMKVNRGSEDPYFFIFSEADDTFRIGINASEGGLPGGTQAVATREDSPIGTAVPFWNSTANRFDTNAGLTFSAASGLDVDNRITANLLTLQNIPNLASEATALVIATDGSVGTRELGTNAFSSAAFALDSSLAEVRTLVNIHEASIGNIYVELGYADASTTALNTLIQNLETSVGALDVLTQDHTADIAQLDASIVRIDAYQAIQDASIAAVGGAWKPYIDGSLAQRDASITVLFAKNAAQDASIIRIDASLNDTIELFDVIDASFQALWAYNAIQDSSIAALEAATPNVANGLQILSDGSIGLGGQLMEDTTIDASNYVFQVGAGDFQDNNVEYSHFYISPNEVFMEYQAPSGDIGAHIGVGSGGEFSLAFNNSFIYDSGDGKGLVYGDDYSSTFDANSLITKAFAESLVDEVSTRIFNAEGDIASLDASIVRIDGSIVNIYDYQAIQDASILALEAATPNVANGLQILSDGSIGLGGQLLESTTIDASDYVFWVGAGDFQGGNQEYSSISISSSQVYMDSGDPTAQVYIRLDSTGRFDLIFNNSVITDNGDGKGLVYNQDYSATFVANSLITKAFAESLVGEVSTRLSTAETDITNIETSLGILNNWNVSQDASIVTLRNTTLSALQTANNGLTANDTSVALGGALTHDTDIDATGYTFSVTGGLSVYGTLTVDGSVTYVNSVDLNVSDNIITVNYGETGPGVTKGFAGLKVDRGTADDYVLVFSEATDTFRIGIANESGLPTGTQAVATREDTPEGFGIPFWNGSLFRFDTSSGFEFTPGVGLSLPIATNDPAEATALMITPAGLVVSRELGTMAFATATDYTLKTLFDSSVAAIWTKFGSVDTSIAGLDTLTQTHTTDINNLESSVGALDLLTQNHTQSIADLSTGKLDAVATVTGILGGHEVFSNEADNIAYIKKIVAGTGATITSDASTITIAVSGAAGYVSKKAGTFDGTAGTSLSITAATHGLGIGPLQVTVYDGTDQVWVDVDCAANGDITLEWTGGSLSASCKYIIMG
ncbi:MAG: hypothetical protein BWY18_00796 [Candidatus Cloacimonetes bacterium ADurb.Bin211]|nr:MAG: hypothetical protein BWY18_00796 [Candidatus Cloacimonetes bacterium ADurb.Bin211]